MSAASTEPELTLWMVDDIPARMFFAGRRWRVSDTPTRLVAGAPVTAAIARRVGGDGWRFQATEPGGEAFVFDVFREGRHWHVHRAYA
jgi:hypothetical protein